jgi:putative ABC transport system permease protein
MSLVAVLRSTSRAPGFTLAVALLVALVAALNAVAFSALWALGWKALPYRDAGSLVELRIDLRDIDLQVALSESMYRRVREQREVFAGAVGWQDAGPALDDDAGRAWQVSRVTGDFAQQLGVSPAAGRSFLPDDAVTGVEPALVLSDRAWRARFNADPSVLGRRLRLQQREYRVVGVMPAGFAFPDATADAWTPYVASAQEREQDAHGAFGQFGVVARLAPGATREQARERLAAIIATHDGLARLRASSAGVRADARAWRERFFGESWRALTLLQYAALLLAVVVVVNVANLCLDRLIARRREFAVRRSLGARERDLVLAAVVDLLPPVVAGALLAALLAPVGLALLRLRGLIPAALPVTVGGDLAMLSAILLVAALVAVAALAIALGSGLRDRADLNSRASAAGLGRARAALLIGQIALSTALVGGTGLLLRSALNVLGEDRGFDSTGVLMTSVDVTAGLPGAAGDVEREPAVLAAFMERLRQEIGGLPGVRHVAYADSMPFSDSHFISRLRLAGAGESIEMRSYGVGSGYFAAMGIPLLRGADFPSRWEGDEMPVVVDELFRRRWLGDADPIGMPVRIETGEGEFGDARIVGVVPRVKHRALDEDLEQASLYQPTAPSPSFFLITRTDGDAALLAEAVRERVRRLAPDAVLHFNRPLSHAIAGTLATRRALLEAVGLFAAMTLGLGALGLYAVLRTMVRRRTAELGVRVALGAGERRILALVMRQGLALVAIGLTLGLGIGLALARLLADRLYRLAPSDTATWVAAGTLVLTVALLACWAPARFAARTQPMLALRHE